MTCPQETELALFAGGEGRDRRISSVEGHIRICERCAQEVVEFRLVRSAVATSGSHMLPNAREQIRAEILERISREPLGRAASHPLLPILRIACVLIVLSASAGLVLTLQPPQAGVMPLASAFDAHRPPAHAFLFSERPEVSPESKTMAPARFDSSGILESAQLKFVELSDGLTRIAQLRIAAKDPSLEIHWIME